LFFFKFGDENNSAYPSRWSVPELKDRQTNISVFSRIFEEYTDAEHFFDFTRKTAAILLQTSIEKNIANMNSNHFSCVFFLLEAASFIFAVSLVLPVIMIGVGKILKRTFLFFCLLKIFRNFKGISNLEECPLDRNIPVFVLVGGAIASLKLLQVLWKQYNRHREPAEEEATDTHNGSVEFILCS
jgi:hypothetical protein